MAYVPITINGRRYDISCDDGQENDVRRLAAELDRRVAAMAGAVGQVGDARLLVMTGLLMAHDLEQRPSGPADARVADYYGAPAGVLDDETFCAQLEELAARIEAIASKLAPSEPDYPDDAPAGGAEVTRGIAEEAESS